MLTKEQKAEWEQLKKEFGLDKIGKELNMRKEREKKVMNKYRVQINHEWKGEQIDQLIILGTAYLDAIDNLDEEFPDRVSSILDVLYCIHPDPGYHFGIYIEEPWEHEAPSHQCDQAWFHCYQGKEEPIMIRPYSIDKWKDGNSENMLYLRFTFEIFRHITVDPSPMGVWQSYLLCLSKTLLPFSGKLYYSKRKLIFSHEQLKFISIFWKPEKKEALLNLSVDFRPSVSIDGNIATVSCCYWNDWQGLIRETAYLTFMGNGKVHIGDFSHQTLFKYNCGIWF